MLIIFFLISADSFQECEHNRKSHQSYAALHEKVGLPVHSIVRLKLHLACARATLGDNDGSIVALATIVLAIFTWRLWISTEKLWRAADAERLANEIVRETDNARVKEQRNDFLKSIESAEKSAAASADQAFLAQQTLIVSQRPWLSVEPFPAADYMTYGDEGAKWAQIHVGLKIKNYGRSPAIAVRFSIEFVDENERAVQDALARVRITSKAITSMAGSDTIPIFPGEEIERGCNANKQVQGDGYKDWVTGYIVGCVSYKFPFGPGDGETTFLCTIAKKTPTTVTLQGGYGITCDETSVAAEDLIYIRYWVGSSAV